MTLTMLSMVYAHRYDQDMTDAYTEFYVEKGSNTSSHTHNLHRAPCLERKNSFKASSKGQVLQESRKREKESLWVNWQVLRGGEGEGEREAHSG
jgi:hypothetical protein